MLWLGPWWGQQVDGRSCSMVATPPLPPPYRLRSCSIFNVVWNVINKPSCRSDFVLLLVLNLSSKVNPNHMCTSVQFAEERGCLHIRIVLRTTNKNRVTLTLQIGYEKPKMDAVKVMLFQSCFSVYSWF